MNIKSELNAFSNAIKICQILIAAGGEMRFVGGCVRDILLAKNPKDIDLATNLDPEQVQRILEENKIKCFDIGKEFGTIGAIINKQQIEVTTLRRDLNCDGRHAQVLFTDNWQEDAQRRDFTINALSADVNGDIYDYFDGISDLKQKIVRFIGNSEERIKEDYLRILRFFRFSAYFSDSIDSSGLSACKKYSKNLKNISGYRIRSEMSKIFFAPHSLEILKIMLRENILQEVIYCNDNSLSYLENLYSIANEFSYQVDELLCWVVFSNDSIPNLPFSRAEKIFFKKLVSVKVTDWDFSNLKQYWRIYKRHFKPFILLNMARSNIKMQCKKELQELFDMPIQALPVTGKDLLELNIAPGKNMGELLNKAEQIWYDHEFKITKQDIIKELFSDAHKL